MSAFEELLYPFVRKMSALDEFSPFLSLRTSFMDGPL